nr:hypothetical protein DBT53_05875 [Aerococcus mictus]
MTFGGIYMKKIVLSVVAIAIVAAGFIFFSRQQEEKKVVLGVSGQSAGMTKYVEQALKEKGYKLELSVAESTIASNEGLMDGSVDVNIMQHEAYMNQFNKDRGASLVKAGKPLFEQFIGVYSRKHKSLDELPDGAKVAIQNDASNIQRALRVLEQAKLIEVKQDIPKGETLTPLDVTSNPHNLEFVELGGGTLIESLDEVDIAIFSGLAAHKAGFKTEDALYKFEPKDLKANALILATKDGNQDKEAVKIIHDAFETKESAELVKEVSGGTWFPYTGD